MLNLVDADYHQKEELAGAISAALSLTPMVEAENEHDTGKIFISGYNLALVQIREMIAMHVTLGEIG